MTTYCYTAYVSGLDLEDEVTVDALLTEDFAIYPAVTDGVGRLTVEIDAVSEEGAVGALRAHLARVFPNASIARLDEQYMNTSQIATELGVTREAVRQWSLDAAFPRHRGILGDGTKAQKYWAWVDVYAWALSSGRGEVADDLVPLSWQTVMVANGKFASKEDANYPDFQFSQSVIEESFALLVEEVLLRISPSQTKGHGRWKFGAIPAVVIDGDGGTDGPDVRTG